MWTAHIMNEKHSEFSNLNAVTIGMSYVILLNHIYHDYNILLIIIR